jgi:hypothetical protein
MRRVPTLPPTSIATQPRTSVVLALGLIAVVTLTLGYVETSSALWFPLFGDATSLSSIDRTDFQLVWPMFGQGVAWIPSWFASGAVGVLTFVLLAHLECGRFPAVCTALALSFSTSFWGWAALEAPVLPAMMFMVGAMGGLLLWRETDRRGPLVVAAVSYGLAIVGHPAALGLVPAVMWAIGFRVVPAAIMTTGAVAGAAGLWWIVSGQTFLGDWFVTDVIASTGSRLRATVALFMGDFGIMGVALLVAGGVRLIGRIDRLVFLVSAAAGVGAWAMVSAAPDWQASLLLAFAPLWLLVGVGMEWAGSQSVTRPARLGIIVLVTLYPTMSFLAHLETGARAKGGSALADRLLDRLELPAGAAIVAEGGLLEHRLAARAGFEPGAGVHRLPQDPTAIVRALQESTPVVGFAGARQNLRALGFQFEDLDSGVFMTVEELIATVPDGWIVAVAAGARFVTTVRPNLGATFSAVGGTQDLYGRVAWHYGLIGVKGGGPARLEGSQRNGLQIDVLAAEPLTPFVRSPDAIRISGAFGDVAVRYKGRTVAQSEDGLALAVISPSGEFQAAYQAEFDQDRGVWVRPPTLNPGVVTGREPCVTVSPRQWTDVSGVVGHGSLGGLLEPAHSLTLYVAADHPLVPKPVRLGDRAPLNIGVLSFDSISEDGRAALGDQPGTERLAAGFDENGRPDKFRLAQQLRAERLDAFAPELLAHSHVYRVQPGTSLRDRRQLALRLGGFATRAFAWLEGGASIPMTLCSAMQAAVTPVVDLDRADLFVYGWDGVERAGDAMFRWTRTPRAELLLPLARPGPITIAINAAAMAGAGTSMALRVNETEFAPVVMQGPEGEYRWDVPAETWRAGMNRVWLGVSALARPSDRSGTGDTRQLGLSIRQIRLIPTVPRPAGIDD